MVGFSAWAAECPTEAHLMQWVCNGLLNAVICLPYMRLYVVYCLWIVDEHYIRSHITSTLHLWSICLSSNPNIIFISGINFKARLVLWYKLGSDGVIQAIIVFLFRFSLIFVCLLSDLWLKTESKIESREQYSRCTACSLSAQWLTDDWPMPDQWSVTIDDQRQLMTVLCLFYPQHVVSCVIVAIKTIGNIMLVGMPSPRPLTTLSRPFSGHFSPQFHVCRNRLSTL